ncbi:hypothetical protein [Micromonospora sp. NPDC049645]
MDRLCFYLSVAADAASLLAGLVVLVSEVRDRWRRDDRPGR